MGVHLSFTRHSWPRRSFQLAFATAGAASLSAEVGAAIPSSLSILYVLDSTSPILTHSWCKTLLFALLWTRKKRISQPLASSRPNRSPGTYFGVMRSDMERSKSIRPSMMPTMTGTPSSPLKGYRPSIVDSDRPKNMPAV